MSKKDVESEESKPIEVPEQISLLPSAEQADVLKVLIAEHERTRREVVKDQERTKQITIESDANTKKVRFGSDGYHFVRGIIAVGLVIAVIAAGIVAHRYVVGRWPSDTDTKGQGQR